MKAATELQQLLSFSSDQERYEHKATFYSLIFVYKIQEVMELKGISKAELAKACDTSRSYITQLFRGHKRLNFLFIAKVFAFLDIEFEVCIKQKS